MKNNGLIIKTMIMMFLFFLPFSSALAFSWAEDEVKQISTNEVITILHTTNTGTETLTSLEDKNRNIFKVANIEPLEENTAMNILMLKDQFYAWSNMKIDEIKFMVSEKGLDISVLPAEFSYSNINILSHLPAGMMFDYKNSLNYNFRIKKDNYFIKIRGSFPGETELCEKIAEVIRDPEEYLKKHDPAYFLMQLQEIKDELDMLRRAIVVLKTEKNISGKIIERVLELKEKYPSYNLYQIQVMLSREKIKLSKKEINTILTVYMNTWSDK